MKKLTLLTLLGIALVLAPACGEDPEVTSDGTAECDEIGELCHPVMTTLGQECHDIGHDRVGSVCLDRYQECKTHCESMAGEGGAGGTPAQGTAGAGGAAQ
jgi:hypothetical protein